MDSLEACAEQVVVGGDEPPHFLAVARAQAPLAALHELLGNDIPGIGCPASVGGDNQSPRSLVKPVARPDECPERRSGQALPHGHRCLWVVAL